MLLLPFKKITIWSFDNISKHHAKPIFNGFIYVNRRVVKWFNNLLTRYDECIVCGVKENLEPHHLNPCHVYDELFYREDNGVVLCNKCHTHYHQTCCTVSEESFWQFFDENHERKYKKRIKNSMKPVKKYNRRKYELSHEYSKIKIRDFRKDKVKQKKISKKRKVKRLNPIYLSYDLGCDDWEYMENVKLEQEVLGDY